MSHWVLLTIILLKYARIPVYTVVCILSRRSYDQWTLSTSIKTPAQAFGDNFDKSAWMNFGRSCYIISITSHARLRSVAALPCEIWIINCTTKNYYSKVIQFTTVQNRLFTLIFYRRCHVLDQLSTKNNLQYYRLCSKVLLSAHTRAFSRAWHHSIANVRTNPADSVMTKLEFCNGDLCSFISPTTMSPLQSLYKLCSFFT